MPTKCMELWSSMVDIAMDRVHVAKKSSSWQREREGIRCWFAKFKFDCAEPLFQVKAHSPSLVFLSHFPSFFAKRCSKSNLNVWRFLDGCFSLGKICKSEHLIQEEWWKFQWNIKEGLKPPVICGWFLRRYYFKTAPNFIANLAKFGH